MNTDFQNLIERIRVKARDRKANIMDNIVYGLARALRYAESDGEANYLAGKYVIRAFSPVRNKKKLNSNCGNNPYFTLRYWLNILAGASRPMILEGCSDETKAAIQEKAAHVRDALDCNYVYIFVREDLPCKEQVVVQAAHATFVAGDKIRRDAMAGKFHLSNYDPNYTHFVVLGVSELAELIDQHDRLVAEGIITYPFYESDLNDEMTAFATQPVQQADRHLFKQGQLLKFNRKESNNG